MNLKENAITAQEILKNHWELANKGEHAKIVLTHGTELDKMDLTICATINAMNEFSASQNADLVKEIERLKNHNTNLSESLSAELFNIDSKETEIEQHKSTIEKHVDLLFESQSKANKLAEELKEYKQVLKKTREGYKNLD